MGDDKVHKAQPERKLCQDRVGDFVLALLYQRDHVTRGLWKQRIGESLYRWG